MGLFIQSKPRLDSLKKCSDSSLVFKELYGEVVLEFCSIKNFTHIYSAVNYLDTLKNLVYFVLSVLENILYFLISLTKKNPLHEDYKYILVLSL